MNNVASKSSAGMSAGIPAHLVSAGLVALLALLFAAPSLLGEYLVHVLILTLFAIVLGVSYRLLMTADAASFCHGTFYGIGGYTVAILTAKAGLSFWLAFPAAGVMAGLGAVVIGYPALRTRGPYFFLMTFGFLMVMQSVFANFVSLTGGFSGIANIPPPAGMSGISSFYYLTLVFTVLSVALFWVIDRSRWGLELRALGDSNDLAQAAGISRFRNMMLAFILGAVFAGFTGGIYASYITFVAPQSFNFWVSVYILTYAVIGGSRQFSGVIIGAIYITLLPIVFNWSQNFVALFVAASIVVIMMLFPEGIVGTLVRWNRERRCPGRVGSLADDRPSPPIVVAPQSRDFSNARPLLKVSGLDKHFGGLHATKSVSFEIREGETLGLIGPNGAGKTTLFNLISGFIRPDKGTVELEGVSIVGKTPDRIARFGLTRTFQASAVFDKLTVHQNLLAAGAAGRGSETEHSALVEDVLQLVGLTAVRDMEAGSLPFGTRKLVGLAVALATRPRLLCLDEPVTGLTGKEVERFVDVLRRLQARGDLAILLVEHRMPVIMNVCDRVIVLSFGEIISQGTPQHVQSDPIVHEVYLG
ncbi:branched-chain amino acid ABC transporter ATP-binding protein/permease [Mesorhizobium australafricanum]|uniref:Branched-chain amino acid ABC transporter ATP-binding protein/permease n=1 Tax=Mesorhizobium australafricanum TaxID=3072311 RepID=A0ABU4X4R3_9HYPH|nr:branched-chain amino acid ABC transporter ATP-binding protein/permease [Mesorhizobium sp. VK3E]MDX8443327.1 branched-chain amino acid ABC transporter ATP-binding protein/permease [Mesorhizobium sp. VK3E]